MFDADEGVKRLLSAQGWQGFAIYFFICQKACRDEGYYLRWRRADEAIVSRMMGCGIGAETVLQTVNTCLRIGLFDRRLFAEGVLTGKDIQRRYLAAVRALGQQAVTGDYWLLKDENSAGVFPAPKIDQSAAEEPQSPVCINTKAQGETDLLLHLHEEPQENPFGDYGPGRPDKNEIVTYAASNLLYMSPGNIEELISFRELLSDELIRYAIDMTTKQGARAFGYTLKILRAFVRRGFKTVGEVKAAEEKRERQRAARKDGRGSAPTEYHEASYKDGW